MIAGLLLLFISIPAKATVVVEGKPVEEYARHIVGELRKLKGVTATLEGTKIKVEKPSEKPAKVELRRFELWNSRWTLVWSFDGQEDRI